MTKDLESVKTSEADGRQTGQIESDLHCKQGVTKRFRLSWLTNSALVHESKCGGEWGRLRGVSALGAQIKVNLWLQTIVRKKFGST
jgi:hypothetical protein